MATFGFSVGDFIAGINLLVKTISAVKDRGSSAEYRTVTGTLKQLSSVFEGLSELEIKDAAQQRALDVLSTKCGQTIFEFLNKMKKYDASLGTPKSTSQLEAAIRRVQWSLCSQEELRKFQAQLQADLLALQTTLQMIHIKLLTAQSRNTTETLVRIERRNEQVKVIQILIVQSLSRCFLEFRGLLLMLFAANMRMINMLLGSLQMQAQVQHERPVYLDDPHERVIPFLRSWIHSWDDFETLLKMQFKRVPGLKKITAGEYVLNDGGRCRDISRSESVDAVFLPGRRITMSMLFDVRKFASACPRCFAPVQGNAVREQKCASCGVLFSVYRIRRPEEDIVFNSSLPSWSFHPLPSPSHQQQVPTGRDPTPPRLAMADSVLAERMENFARIKVAERVGQWPRQKRVTESNKTKEREKEIPFSEKAYVPYAPDKDTDPVLRWFRNVGLQDSTSGDYKPIFDEEMLYQLLEMDDDDNHDFSRSLVNEWERQFVSTLHEMKKKWYVE